MAPPTQDENAATVAYYDDNSAAFAARTLNIPMGHVQASFLRELAPGSRILDLGCGAGRDSRAFLAAGYSVTAVDASSEIVRIASEVTGQDALQMRFEELEFVEEFDGVWAAASLLHVRREDMPGILARVVRSLRRGGVLQLSVVYGQGEEFRRGRWFYDYTVATLHAVLDPVPTLNPARHWVRQDRRRPDSQWLNAFARRTP